MFLNSKLEIYQITHSSSTQARQRLCLVLSSISPFFHHHTWRDDVLFQCITALAYCMIIVIASYCLFLSYCHLQSDIFWFFCHASIFWYCWHNIFKFRDYKNWNTKLMIMIQYVSINIWRHFNLIQLIKNQTIFLDCFLWCFICVKFEFSILFKNII